MSTPDPMTPPDCDLRGMPFMPLDVVRLGDSDLFALSTGDEFKAAVTLWCKSWLQVPAGSLPKDDRILAHLSMTGSAWRKLKDTALRGWGECSDGRLYHPVVAEKANRAWAALVAARARIDRRTLMESGEWSRLRSAVFHRDDYTCRYCGDRGGRLECDHVQPLSRGGSSDPDNLVTACLSCNRRKGAKLPQEWMA